MNHGKTILITGASGYLATNLIERLRLSKCRIVCLSRTVLKQRPAAGKAHIQYVTGDIRKKAVLERCLTGVDLVFHLAAQTSVAKAEANPEVDFQINVLPMLRILEICRRRGLRPDVIMAGTATEVGLIGSPRVEESHPDHPVTTYDLHKRMAEDYLKLYSHRGVVRGTILRLFNVYGPGPLSQSPSRGILNRMIQKALRGEDLSIYGVGDCIRDYVYIDDVIDAFLLSARHIRKVNGRHFYIGSGRGVTLYDAFRLVAARCAEKTGVRVNIRRVAPPAAALPIEERNYIADTSGFRHVTRWKPATVFRDGIDRTISSFMTNPRNQ